MKITSNFICFHDKFGLKKTIDIFSDAGFEGIDFNADLKEYYTDIHDDAFYKEIQSYANARGIVFDQTHAPFATSFADADQTKQRFGEIVKSMEHSALLGAKMIVVHPCGHAPCDSESQYAHMMDYNYNFYKGLQPYAESFGLQIAIENIPTYVTGTAEGMLSLYNALGSETFTFCFDVGHANVHGGDPVEMIRKIGGHIGCTHIHDNDGTVDAHTLPYYGKIDWENVMQALAEAGYAGNLNYEAGYFVRDLPIELRDKSAVYMAEVAKQLRARYMYYKSIL